MKILMIGGTGNISGAVSELLIRQGHDLYLYCMDNGIHGDLAMEGAVIRYGDINDEESMGSFLEGHTFDVIADWTVMTPDQARRDIRLFAGRTSQYFFISSSSAYLKPPKGYLITEETPLGNPFWEYSRNKIECERVMTEAYETTGFPVTIVRPSLTYGNTVIPYILGSWNKPWSLVDRIRRGKRVIVPGDGTSLWVITHNSDFAGGIAGLMGKDKAIGEAFHITSDEVLTWDGILDRIAEAVGAEARRVHISSEFITAYMPEQLGNLYGDKIVSAVFDNSKLKSIVPDFKAAVSFREGIARTYAFLESHPEMQGIDAEFERSLDKVIEAHDYGMSFLNSLDIQA